MNMPKGRNIVSCAAGELLTVAGSGSVSADERLPPTTTTVVEEFDRESGLNGSQIDEQTIEVSALD